MTEPVEHRLALVLNGGISLAVWMGGIAQEIDDLRRATSGLTGAESELLALWKQAADAHGETITVDVIGGTSAGGLNGVFFAAAIARGATMGALRDIWLRDAQLSPAALLRPQTPTSHSVLNGDFFLEAIASSLDAIGPEVAADARHVSLTTTASAFAGLPRVLVDSFGSAFAQSDHRRRYRLEDTETRIHYERDADGVWGFASQDGHHDLRLGDGVVREALSRAGRATASIPGVFTPVEETPALRDRRVWPTWPTRAPDDDRDEWLLDGGLLDNSPFTPVLELVAKQSVAATWKRTVCYIAPDAAMPDPPAAATAPPGTPPPWDLAVGRLQSFPGEVSFRDDMDLLGGMIRAARANEDVTRFRVLVASPATEVDGPTGAAATAAALLPRYRRSRTTAALLEAIEVVNGGADSILKPPTQLRSLDTVAAAAHAWSPAAFPGTAADLEGPWFWGLAGADRVVRLLLHALQETPDATTARAAVSDALHRVAAVRVAVEKALHDDVSTRPWRPDDAEVVATRLDGVFTELGVPQVLGDLVLNAATAFATTLPATSVLDVVRAALGIEVVNGAPGLAVQTDTTPVFDFVRFGIGDIPAFLTPTGAATSTASVLYGTRLGRFAAFGRPEWRAWDWLWGRIHGAVHLGRLLDLSDEQLQPIIERIITAEGTTVEAVRSRIPAMLSGETDADLLRDLQGDGRLTEAADALFAVLGTPAATDPAIQPVVATAAAIVTSALGRRTHGTKRHTLIRFIAWIPRRLVWRRLRRE